MKKLSLPAVILIAAGLIFCGTGCNSPTNTSADLGRTFSLPVGHTVEIKNEPLTITFSQVISDSRCPSGAVCVWQGEVSIKLEITYGNSSYIKVLTQPGLTDTPSNTDFAGYSLQFSVLPYPVKGGQISNKSYRLEMVITKKQS